MPDTPKRLSYKFQRLREAIRDAIQKGELERKLPGERELARRFGVNAKTISKALTDLTSEGLLVRQVGRGTFVAGYDGASALSGRRNYLWLTANDLDPDFLSAMFGLAQDRLQVRGHEISLERVATDESGELPERCLAISKLKAQSGVLVFSSVPSRGLIADLYRRRIPVVLCSTSSRSLKVNSVTADYSQGIFELTEHLIQLGHRRILLAMDRRAVCAAGQAHRGYQTAMARRGLEALEPARCTSNDPTNVLQVYPKPTAIISLGGALAATLKQQEHRLAPSGVERVSLAAMAAPGQLMPQQLGITSYDVYPDEVLDWAMQLLFDAAPGAEPRNVIVPGVFNDRGSASGIATPNVNPKAQHVIL